MNNYYQSEDSILSSQDIESQMPEIQRKCSLIKSIQIWDNKPRPFNYGNDLNYQRKYMPSHHSTNRLRFYKQRVAVYNFIQRPHGFIPIAYHIFVSCLVFTCLILTVLSTISDYENGASNCLKIADSFIVILFSTEFTACLWSSSCISHYRGFRGKLRFFRSPFRIIDLFIIITSSIVLFFDMDNPLLTTSLKGVRFFQVFQMLRLEHRFRPWRMMASVVCAQREHLAITTYMGFLALLFISFIMYFIEKEYNPAFNSLASSLWWGVITLCTIGYGDMYPITPIGKLLSCICSLIGVSLFALPAGILGTGLALKVQEQQRQRKLCKRQTPAAKLIQSVWRRYAANKHSKSSVIWRAYFNSKPQFYAPNIHQMNAIRFILVVKYLIARKEFSKAFKPYDIKDVLEQYASGHIDMLARVKHMDRKLNNIEANVNISLKTQHESKYILTARVEHFLKDSQKSFSQLKEMQFENKIMLNNILKLLSSNYENNIKLQIKSESSHLNMSYTRRKSF